MRRRPKREPASEPPVTQPASGPPPTAPPSEPKSPLYNPHFLGHGVAAKLWELLRRNPAFREQVHELVRLGNRIKSEKQEAERIACLLEEVDSRNPVAGYVLHWIFEPEFMDVEYPSGMVPLNPQRSTADYVQSVLPHISNSEAQRIADRGLSIFCSEFPFYLRRDLHVFKQEHRCKELPSNPILGPIWDVRLRKSFPGKLKFNTGRFNLETAWLETPPLFQEQFQWLWAGYDVNVLSPYTGDRAYFPAAGPVNWLFDETEDNPNFYARLNVYRNNYFLFGVPFQYVYSERNLNDIVESFKARLYQEFFPVIGPRRLESTPKYPQLLGKGLEWEVFAFCYPLLEYMNKPERPREPMRLPLRSAIKPYCSWRKKGGKQGKEEAQAEENYKRMEFLMTAVYPEFDFESLLWVSRLQPNDHIEKVIQQCIPRPPHIQG